MTASEDALHFWDIGDGVREEPQSITFNSTGSYSGFAIIYFIVCKLNVL
jgi:hypothetical protein